jgi:hypothetical protein
MWFLLGLVLESRIAARGQFKAEAHRLVPV